MSKVILPVTRYYGSKRKLVGKIWEVIESKGLEFDSVLDLFGGSAIFSYYAKRKGKRVFYNDIFKFNTVVGKKLIEENSNLLDIDEALNLLKARPDVNYSSVISDNFHGIYFTNEENELIDIFLQNLNLLDSENKRHSALYILFQSCIIKRPYNLFHRNNLSMRTNFTNGNFGNKKTWERPFEELFIRFIEELDAVTFANGENNKAVNFPALGCPIQSDLVYIDPPYFSQSRNHTSYHSKYHFLEGLVNYESIEENIDFEKRNRQILINKNSQFENIKNFNHDLQQLLELHRDSNIVISYRNNGIPSIEEIFRLVRSVKPRNRVHVVDLGLYGYALNRKNTTNREFLIIGEG